MARQIILNYDTPALKYPKMHTLYMRDFDKKKNPIIEGKYSKKEFQVINRYLVTEKIDGTNVRILWNGEHMEIRGRNDRSQMRVPLYNNLHQIFTVEKLSSVFHPPEENQTQNIILFGEGFGCGINKGGHLYRSDPSFIVFDIFIDGWWLEYDMMQEIANQLEIACVPSLGIWTIPEIVEYIKSKPMSVFAQTYNQQERPMEGIVASSTPLLLFRNGDPLKFKLKIKDFK